MLLFIFVILLLAVIGKLIGLAIKATWGITKILFNIVLLPIVLIALVCAGLVYIAIPVLIIVGIVALVGPSK